MAGITVAIAQAQLDAWLACSIAVASNQSYSMSIEGNERTLTRANAAWIANMINYWKGELAKATRAESGEARGRTRYLVN